MKTNYKVEGFSKTTILNSFLYILIFICIIWNSGYALSKTSWNIARPLLYVTVVACLIATVIKNNGKIQMKCNLANMWYWWFVISFIISAVFNINKDNLKSALFMIILITTARAISRIITFETFVKVFITTMKLLTIISIVSFLIVNRIGPNWLPKILNYNGVTYYNGILFFFQYNDIGIISRCMSIFWEPGVYASFLIIALIFESCFKNEKESKLNIIIFITGIIFSSSSAGYLLLLLYIALRMSMNKGAKYIIAMVISVVAAILIFIFANSLQNLLLQLNYDLFYKFFYSNNITSGTRIYSPLINFNIFLESPLFGVGFSTADTLYSMLMESYKSVYYVVAQTSTSTIFLASSGVLGLVYSFSLFFPVLKIKRLNLITRLIISAILLLIVNKEPHTSMLVTYCIMFYFIYYNLNEKKEYL